MAEAYNSFTEVDPGNDLSQTAARSTWVNLSDNDAAYLYKDYGVDHFSGDFEHLLDAQLVASDNDVAAGFWGLANALGEMNADFRASPNRMLNAHFYRTALGARQLALREYGNGVLEVWSDFYVCAIGTTYYQKIKRVGNTLTDEIYSDAARTILLDTLTLVLNYTDNFRYLYGAQTDEWNSGAVISGWVENLDLQEVRGAFYQASNPFGINILSAGSVRTG